MYWRENNCVLLTSIDSVVIKHNDESIQRINDVKTNEYYFPSKEKYKNITNASEITISPNPFKTSVKISVSVPESIEGLQFAIYTLEGRCIKKFKTSGMSHEYIIEWDGSDENGSVVGSGLYNLRVSSKAGDSVHKIIKL